MVLRAKLGWKRARRVGVAAGLVWTGFFAGSPANAQAVSSPQESTANFRLLTSEEGRVIVNAAWEQNQPAGGSQDCSHVVHEIYVKAGFEYAYASSFDIYTGNENFARVKTPQAGDLIVWPGHVGIIVDPLQHSFYSLVSTGFEAQDYQGLYWKSRGKPRFYRFKVEDSKTVTVAKAAPPARTPKSERQSGGALVTEKHSAAEYSAANRPPKAASERTAAFHGTRPPDDADAPALTTEVPPSILIVTGKKQPTREEVTEGISEYSNAAGNVLRAGDPAKLRSPVVIFERFNVERVEIKRDHGWAHLQIDSKVSVSANGAELKKRREKVRWELRRTESGWEAVPPPDRTYVPRDMAVKNLAGHLARLTESGGAAAANQEALLRQESQLASLLSVLLNQK
jgi:hypothetical protein